MHTCVQSKQEGSEEDTNIGLISASVVGRVAAISRVSEDPKSDHSFIPSLQHVTNFLIQGITEQYITEK